MLYLFDHCARRFWPREAGRNVLPHHEASNVFTMHFYFLLWRIAEAIYLKLNYVCLMAEIINARNYFCIGAPAMHRIQMGECGSKSHGERGARRYRN